MDRMKPKYNVLLLSVLLTAAVFLGGCVQQNAQDITSGQNQSAGPVKCNDLPCLAQRFPSCTPAEMAMSAVGQSVKVTIYGFENEKCHYVMMFGNVTAANCYFKSEDLTSKVLNQMFGNNEGQDAIIAEACGQ